MRPWHFVALFLSLPLGLPSPATAQAPGVPVDLAANAALKYWQAFALLPSLDKDQEKLLKEWDRIPLDAAARQLIDTSDKSRMYLQRGARLPRCDWSLDYNDGINLLLPHLGKALTLARLTALHARHELAQGRFAEGVADATAVLTLARQLDPDPSLISSLVRYRIEAIGIEILAPYLPQLDAASVRTLAAQLDNLPLGANLPQKLLAEKQYQLGSVIRILQEAEKKVGAWRDTLREIVGGAGGPDPSEAIGTLAQAIQMLEDLAPTFDAYAKLVALPHEEYDAQYPEFVKKAKANPLAGAFLPGASTVIASERRSLALMALLKAALAVAQDGPDRLKAIRDPFGKGPFAYRALERGFELKSKLLFRDQPVTLVVGQGHKE